MIAFLIGAALFAFARYTIPTVPQETAYAPRWAEVVGFVGLLLMAVGPVQIWFHLVS